MKRRSSSVTRSSIARRSRRSPTTVSKPAGASLDLIAQALDRWLTLCVTGKRIPQRVWDDLATACGVLQVHQVRGNGPKADMVRAWLGYRAAQTAVQRGTLRCTDAAFHEAYLAWQNWKQSGRHAKA